MNAEELKKEEPKVRVYDFKRALRFSKDQIRSISRIYENYARLLTTFFSGQLRTYVNLSVASVDQIPYEEFIRSIPTKIGRASCRERAWISEDATLIQENI